MNLYAHAVLAQKLLPLARPADPAAYLWGAVIPDIRYLVGMRRKTTHLTNEEITRWFEQYPGCESFIQGYRVHCLLDLIDTAHILGSQFPLNLLRGIRRKPLSTQQAAVMIELYYHQDVPQGITLIGEHNAILETLGISAEQTQVYADALADYLAAPSFNTAASAFARLGVIDDTRIEKYVSAYHGIQKNRLLMGVMMASAKNARLEELAVAEYHNLVSAPASRQ